MSRPEQSPPRSKDDYDWGVFTEKSSGVYASVAASGDLQALRNHNVVSEGNIDREIDFIRVLAGLPRPTPSGMSALDVCSGAGLFSEGLRRNGFAVTAVELDAAAVEIGRANFPDITFHCHDASRPDEVEFDRKFDLIVFREAHPFSRIGELAFHTALLEKYAALLKSSGVMVIAHANRGGDLQSPSVDFDKLRAWYRQHGGRTVGPLFHFAYRHLGLRTTNMAVLRITSWLSRLASRAANTRWIQFFVIFPRT